MKRLDFTIKKKSKSKIFNREQKLNLTLNFKQEI